jgi:hypothetical protein
MALVTYAEKLDSQLGLEGLNITCRVSDGYVNASQLCKAGKKLFNHWNENAKSKAFLEELSKSQSHGYPCDSLVKYEDNGPLNRATWVHPRVAINIAQWISPKFDVKVSAWVHELLVKGRVYYGCEGTEEDIMGEQINNLNAAIALRDGDIERYNELVKTKDDKIDQLNAKIDKLLKYGEDTKGLVNGLTVTSRRTEELLVDVAKRAVPQVNTNKVNEIFGLFHVSDNKYYMIRTQERSYNNAVKIQTTKKGFQFREVRKWVCAPNSVMLSHSIRENLRDGYKIIEMSGNDIILINGTTEKKLSNGINSLYKSAYIRS